MSCLSTGENSEYLILVISLHPARQKDPRPSHTLQYSRPLHRAVNRAFQVNPSRNLQEWGNEMDRHSNASARCQLNGKQLSIEILTPARLQPEAGEYPVESDSKAMTLCIGQGPSTSQISALYLALHHLLLLPLMRN